MVVERMENEYLSATLKEGFPTPAGSLHDLGECQAEFTQSQQRGPGTHLASHLIHSFRNLAWETHLTRVTSIERAEVVKW